MYLKKKQDLDTFDKEETNDDSFHTQYVLNKIQKHIRAQQPTFQSALFDCFVSGKPSQQQQNLIFSR